MAAISLNNEESQKLVDVIEKIKNSKAYKNYLAGVGLSLKRAASLKGEGDAFAKIGETLRSGKIPPFLNATAKGQQKVQDALFAELKQQKLHGVLKDEEFNDTIYRELYVKPGTLKKYLGISSQEEQMSENDSKTEPTAEEITGQKNWVELPKYYDEEKFADLEIKIVDGKISKEDLEKLEEKRKSLESDGNGNQPGSQQTGDGQEGGESAGSGDGAIEVDGMEGEGPRTTEKEDPDWVKKYDEALTKYGRENGNEWVRDNEADENGERPAGLKGKFANGTEVHYTDKDKLSVKTPEGEKPNADHFKEIVALAKDNNQEIKLGTTMTPEFKAALIEACAKGGIEMQGLSAEDREVYDSFKPKEEKQEEKEENTEEDTSKPVEKKEFLQDDYYSYFRPDSAKVRYNMMERLAATPAKDINFKEMSNKTALDEKIASLQKAGAIIGKDSKESAELTLAEYAKLSVAAAKGGLDEGGKEKLADLEKALGRYNLNVHKENKDDGKGGSVTETVIEPKKMSERSREEQEDIKYAVLKLQPQDRKYSPDIRDMTMSHSQRVH